MKDKRPSPLAHNRLKIGILLTLGLAFAAGCRTYVPEEGEICTFEFPFMGDYDVSNRTTFNWHDTYVTNSSYRYHHELAGPLAAFAASTYGSRLFMDARTLMDLAVPPERLMRCYEENGKLRYNHPKYGRDVVGFTIGSRMSEIPGNDFSIVFVAIRGTVGLEDWLSNINMANEWGSSTNLNLETLPKLHEGFHKSALFVMDALEQYVKDYKIDLSKAKILVTGHSRGAAAANIVGKLLDDASGEEGSPFEQVKRDNVFVYSIATPNVTIRAAPDAADEKYRNIFSIVSAEDIVPLVPFAEWGGAHYGRTLVLKSWSTIFWGGSYLHPAYVGMKNNFKDIVGYEYWHMFWGTFLVEKIPALAMRIAPTVRHFYYVPPEMRKNGNTTSTHSFLEMIFWKNIPSSTDPLRHCSLMGDVASLTQAYDTMTDGSVTEGRSAPRHWDHKLRFLHAKEESEGFNPDGRDFSVQPGLFDTVWKITCMHAPATYISWMKSGVDHGPDSIYDNWDDVCGDEEE